ncbi:MAG: NADH-quinone oxidoreductase subunit C, partial [Chloroflexi bacterium]|nr:NADH-quinone oxidoreductase subunit C [Chloroflexota bacterium]
MSAYLQTVEEKVRARFGDAVAASTFRGELTLVVPRDQLLDVARMLRDELGFDFLADLTAVDYWPEGQPRFHV